MQVAMVAARFMSVAMAATTLCLVAGCSSQQSETAPPTAGPGTSASSAAMSPGVQEAKMNPAQRAAFEEKFGEKLRQQAAGGPAPNVGTTQKVSGGTYYLLERNMTDKQRDQFNATHEPKIVGYKGP